MVEFHKIKNGWIPSEVCICCHNVDIVSTSRIFYLFKELQKSFNYTLFQAYKIA